MTCTCSKLTLNIHL